MPTRPKRVLIVASAAFALAGVAALLLRRVAAKSLIPSRASGLQASGAQAMDVIRAYSLALGLIAACFCVAALAVWFSGRDRGRTERAWWSASGLALGAGAGVCGGVAAFFLDAGASRSEERRVGKGWWWWWWV